MQNAVQNAVPLCAKCTFAMIKNVPEGRRYLGCHYDPKIRNHADAEQHCPLTHAPAIQVGDIVTAHRSGYWKVVKLMPATNSMPQMNFDRVVLVKVAEQGMMPIKRKTTYTDYACYCSVITPGWLHKRLEDATKTCRMMQDQARIL